MGKTKSSTHRVPVDSTIRSRPQPDDAGLRALRQGIREAKRWYEFCGVDMVIADADGTVRHVPPSQVFPDDAGDEPVPDPVGDPASDLGKIVARP